MTKSNHLGLLEPAAPALLGGLFAWWRAGLARAGRPLTYGGIGYDIGWLGALMAVAACGLLAVALIGHRRRQAVTAGRGCAAASGLAALGMLAAAGLLLAESLPAPGLFVLVQIAFLALCGATVLLRALRGEDAPGAGLLSLFPVYYLCLILLAFYRENAKNPVVSSFALEILTLAALAVAVYGLSARHFGRFQPRLHAFFSLTAIFMACLELASAALYPQLLLSVPGVTPAMLTMMASMALYVAAGFFLKPRPAAAQPNPRDTSWLHGPSAQTEDGPGEASEDGIGEASDEADEPPET